MFSRKRRFYEKKTFYVAVIAAFTLVFSLGLWMDGEEPEQREREPMKPLEQTVSSDQVDKNIGQAGISKTNPLEQSAPETYFVIEEAGYIKVYEVDGSGEKTLIRTSDILFDLLGTEDQALFRSGISLDTKEQLMELLQDFES